MLRRKVITVKIEEDYKDLLESKRLASNLSRVELLNEAFYTFRKRLTKIKTTEFKLTDIDRHKLCSYRIVFIDNSFMKIEKLTKKLNVSIGRLSRELLLSYIEERN